MESFVRRRLILLGATSLGGAGLASVLSACAGHGARDPHDEKDDPGDDIAPPEDLMREHGLLNRVLLVYEEGIRRLDDERATLPPDALSTAAEIVQHFVEDYHEKLEEDFLFPRFEKARKLADLVATLRRQHQAGRALTQEIRRLSAPLAAAPDDKKRLAAALGAFVRMYRPHEAREDTVLFPAIRDVIPKKEFEALGEQFEDQEHALFGKDGFEGMVVRVAKLEQSLGIYDLNQFTP